MEEGSHVIKLGPASVYDNNFSAPFIYNALADHFKLIQTTDYTLTLDHRERAKIFGVPTLEKLEKDGSIIIGYDTEKNPLIVNKANEFFVSKKDKLTAVGNVYSVLRLEESNAPVDYAEVSVFSKKIPVGIVLGNKLGFVNLVKLLGAKHRISIGRNTPHLEPNEYAIKFKDKQYIFDRRDSISSMILSGYNSFEKELRKYDAEEFNNKNVYFNLLSSKGMGSLYIRELNLLEDLFVDSITKDLLVSTGQPTTYHGLLLESCAHLTTYGHPDSQDMNYMRVRGYERIPGLVYKEMVAAIRSFKNRNIAGKSRIEMSPYKIWQTLLEDPAKKMVEDINPIQNLKESEIVTYVGEGGRSKDAMNKESRAYHVNDMGVVSEATVDSSDVGINAYLSANPNFDNMLGISKVKKDLTPTSLMSTSANLAPGVSHDQGPRVNFCSIQNSHTIAVEGARQPYVQTGYESVIADRTTEMFATTAEQDGKVINLTPNGIIVEYKDGTKKGVTLGRVYGRAEGSVYPHDIITPLTETSKFKKGDVIAYNSGFFEPSFLDPARIVMKTNMPVKVALYESAQTHEDSSAISLELSRKLRTRTTKVKSFTVNFNQNILDIVKLNQSVMPKTVLMIIEDEITSAANVFDEKSLATLRKLSAHSPRAGYQGTIDRIEVFYNGDKSDMTSSLKAIADKSDRLLTEINRSSNKPVYNGQVNSDYRVNGVPLAMDKAEIKIYITIETNAGVGD
jgi:hypothetical protein